MPIPPNDQVKDALKKMMEEREKFSDADSKDGKEILSMYIMGESSFIHPVLPTQQGSGFKNSTMVQPVQQV